MINMIVKQDLKVLFNVGDVQLNCRKNRVIQIANKLLVVLTSLKIIFHIFNELIMGYFLKKLS